MAPPQTSRAPPSAASAGPAKQTAANRYVQNESTCKDMLAVHMPVAIEFPEPLLQLLKLMSYWPVREVLLKLLNVAASQSVLMLADCTCLMASPLVHFDMSC